MVSSDPISDMLTRIRNAAMVNKSEVSLPHSKIKETVAKILAENGFLQSVEVNGSDKDKKLVITIAPENSSSTITEIARISKPGRRVYVNSSEIPTVKRGRGIVVISTSKGVMAGSEAKQKKLGGELICQVY
jgi:small subunit ribosomal protein S8